MSESHIRARLWLLAVPLLLSTALLCAVAPRPKLDNHVSVWLPQSAPQLLERYQRFVALFGNDEAATVIVEGGDLEGLLRLSTELGEELEREGVAARVLNAARCYPEEVDVLLDPDLGGFSSENQQRLAPYFKGPLNAALQLYRPKLGRVTLITPTRANKASDQERLSAILERYRARAEAAGRRFLVAGSSLVNLELDRASRAVEARAMPALIAICAVILVLATRSLGASVALFSVVGLGVLSSDALLGLWGGSTNLLVTVVKPLLFVLLLAGGLHIVIAFQAERAAASGPFAAALSALRHKRRACATALLTTALGFSSLGLSDVAPIRSFGLLSAVGLLLGGALLLGALPPLLALLPHRPRDDPGGGLSGRCARRLAKLGGRCPRLTCLAALATCVLGLGLIPTLRAEPHAINYFDTDHPLRRDHRAIEQRGFGLGTLELMLTRREGSWLDHRPELTRLDKFARELEALPGVRGAIGLPLLLREAGYRSAKVDAIPAQYFLSRLELLEDGSTAAFMADEGRCLRVSLPVETLDAEALDILEDKITAAFARRFPGPDIHLEQTGVYRLLLETQRSLLDTLRGSLLSTALLMGVIIVIALRSLRLGLLSIIPNALPVATNFIIMRLVDIPLDVGTTMTAAVALGIAVDDTIHVLSAVQKRGVEEAMGETGKAVLLSSVIIGAGFLSLLSSDFAPTRAFGLLCASALAMALAADLVVLPALLALRPDQSDP